MTGQDCLDNIVYKVNDKNKLCKGGNRQIRKPTTLRTERKYKKVATLKQ